MEDLTSAQEKDNKTNMFIYYIRITLPPVQWIKQAENGTQLDDNIKNMEPNLFRKVAST